MRALRARLFLASTTTVSALVFGCSAATPDTSPRANEAAEAGVAATLDPTPESATTARPWRRGIVRHRDTAPTPDTTTPSCKNPALSYFGGPIVQSPVVIPVNWNSNVNAEVQSSMGQFYADVMQSSYWTWLQEYDTVGLTGGSEQAILPGTVGTSVTLTPSHCPATTSSTTCDLSDTQIQAELTAQIAAGILPAPVVDCTGNTQTIYMINFPPNVFLSGPNGAGASCQQFCAYHNTGTYGTSSTPLIYGVLMDEYAGGCASGCGGNATVLENVTETASHELVEAITDPDIGLVPATAPGYEAPAGWADNNNSCGEIGDICDDGKVGDTITVSGRTWTVQELWSNSQKKCASSGTALPVCSGTTLTGCRKCSCGDNGGACTGGTSVCETTSTNVLFGACEQCTSKSTTCTSGATCTQSTTPSLDDVCSGGSCVPATSCPTGFDCGTAPDGCGGTLHCGTCTAPQTCGGSGTVNVCGCTPLTMCPAGFVCGTAPNGCGGAVLCGTCGLDETCVANACVSAATDAGPADAGPTDSGVTDAGETDAGPKDSGLTDAGPKDSGVTEAGETDAGPKDSGVTDAGETDAGPKDSGVTDVGETDAGPKDGGVTDAGTIDAGPLDGGSTTDASTDDVATTSDAVSSDASAIDASGGEVDTTDGAVATDAGDETTVTTDAANDETSDATAFDAASFDADVSDATATDARASADAGTGTSSSGGCSCRTAPAAGDRSSSTTLTLGAIGLLGVMRLRRRSKRTSANGTER